MKVVICTPTLTQPYQVLLDAIRAEVPLLDAAGIEHGVKWEVGSPYISHARSSALRAALDAKADVIVFIDHDMSWTPGALVKLIQTPGDVVSGLYRFKYEPEAYMGSIRPGADKRPIERDDGCVLMDWVPAGFLKVTKEGVDRFMRAYPDLCYGPRFSLSVDMFNHGAHDGLWWGEDYAFSRRWNAMGEEIWVVPDLDLTHHTKDAAFPGNYAAFLRRQPGGSEDPARLPPLSAA